MESEDEPVHFSSDSAEQPTTEQQKASAWLAQTFVFRERRTVPKGKVYNMYLRYCAKNHQRPLAPNVLGRLVYAVFGGLKTARKGSRKTARYHYLHLDKRQPLQSNPTSPTPTSCGSAPPSLPSSPVQDQDASLLDLLKDTSDPFLAFNPTRYILDPALEAPTKEEKRHPMEINQPVLGWEMEEEELFDISRQEELRWIEELNSVWAELYNTVKSLLEDESSNASSFSSMGAVFVQFWREEFEHKGLRRLLDTSWGRSILLMTEQNELASLMGSNIPLNTLRLLPVIIQTSARGVVDSDFLASHGRMIEQCFLTAGR